MEFRIIDRFSKPPYKAKSRAYLTWDNWNDYSFYTLFGLIYVDENSESHNIGSVKIGYLGQQEGLDKKRLAIGDTFENLGEDFFSLGQSDEYYSNLLSLGDIIRDEILEALRDIAKNSDLYSQVIKERVTKISLLRSVSETSVTGQFRRLATGGARLTNYSFDFVTPSIRNKATSMKLSFHVIPESSPPTNVHIIIGRNGVGKTHLLTSMIDTLIKDELEDSKKLGEFIQELKNEDEKIFANLISISFSAFDESVPKPERKDKTAGIQYSYIGLKRIQTGNGKKLAPKSTTILRNEFFNSLNNCKAIGRIKRWKKIIGMLESDPMFSEAEIKLLVDFKDEEEFKNQSHNTFTRLSSGHKIILLTLTRLIETLEEKSLVLIDEPEAHLHPPLLATFIRALSKLLIDTNGVAIMATHSPVILQEVPKTCIWKLRRNGAQAIAERPQIESFGENIGILTQEVFGLEVTNSGFHKVLRDMVETYESYETAVEILNNQVGLEGKAILHSLFYQKNRINEQNT